MRPAPPFMTLLLLFLLSALLPAAKAATEADLDNGEEINELCAGCHGEYAQGGSEGEYPRLAGQPKVDPSVKTEIA